MLKGVVFDLDHTLFDRYATLRAIMPSFCCHFDMSEGMTAEKAAELLCFADKNFVHIGWHKILEYLAEQNMFSSVPDFDSYSAFILSKFAEIAVPYSFTKPTLQKLRDMGLKLGLITNGNEKLQSKKIELLSFESEFDQIIISGAFGIHKPAPEPFLAMAERLNVDPSELIYVGDNPLNDVEGSRGAGYTPVFVRTTGTWVFPDIEKPEFQIDNVGELPALLEKHFKLQ